MELIDPSMKGVSENIRTIFSVVSLLKKNDFTKSSGGCLAGGSKMQRNASRIDDKRQWRKRRLARPANR